MLKSVQPLRGTYPQVARLYVVSDVLHNSSASVRNASAYRTLLEAALPTVFESLRSALRGDGVGRIAAEQLKRRVLGVLRVWENWFLFPEAYLTGLQVRLEDSGSQYPLFVSGSLLLAAVADAGLQTAQERGQRVTLGSGGYRAWGLWTEGGGTCTTLQEERHRECVDALTARIDRFSRWVAEATSVCTDSNRRRSCGRTGRRRRTRSWRRSWRG